MGCACYLAELSKIPAAQDERRSDVFLYNKAHLRANGPTPEPEALPLIAVNGARAMSLFGAGGVHGAVACSHASI